MGMNIYTLEGKHIGKRWAAGVWCWDCKETLNRGEGLNDSFVLDKCPVCGKEKPKVTKYNPAFRELGFDKSEPEKHTGIDGASGFIWQIGESGIGESVNEVRKNLKRYKYLIDEYGRKMTIEEFDKMFSDIIIEDTENCDFS